MHNKKGFSLVEVMVVIGISSFILSATYGVLNVSRRSWLTGEASLSLQQNARMALDRLRRDLRMASAATVDVEKRVLTFNVPIDADNDGYLDVLAGTNTTIYGADDPDDFDNDGILYEAGWNIGYQIVPAGKQIIRRVLTDTGAEANRRVVANNIQPGMAHTNFETETGGTGVTNTAVIITITIMVDSIEGSQINPPMKFSLKTRVNLRN